MGANDLQKSVMANWKPSDVFKDAQKVKWEEDCVKQLLSVFKSQERKWDLLKESSQYCQNPRLRLCDFCNMFPKFPISLRSCLMTTADVPTIVGMMENFKHVKLGINWCDEWSRLSSQEKSRGLGVIFKWPRLRLGMVLHNVAPFQVESGGASRLVWSDKGLTLVMQPWAAVLDYMAKRFFNPCVV